MDRNDLYRYYNNNATDRDFDEYQFYETREPHSQFYNPITVQDHYYGPRIHQDPYQILRRQNEPNFFASYSENSMYFVPSAAKMTKKEKDLHQKISVKAQTNQSIFDRIKQDQLETKEFLDKKFFEERNIVATNREPRNCETLVEKMDLKRDSYSRILSLQRLYGLQTKFNVIPSQCYGTIVDPVQNSTKSDRICTLISSNKENGAFYDYYQGIENARSVGVERETELLAAFQVEGTLEHFWDKETVHIISDEFPVTVIRTISETLAVFNKEQLGRLPQFLSMEEFKILEQQISWVIESLYFETQKGSALDRDQPEPFYWWFELQKKATTPPIVVNYAFDYLLAKLSDHLEFSDLKTTAVIGYTVGICPRLEEEQLSISNGHDFAKERLLQIPVHHYIDNMSIHEWISVVMHPERGILDAPVGPLYEALSLDQKRVTVRAVVTHKNLSFFKQAKITTLDDVIPFIDYETTAPVINEEIRFELNPHTFLDSKEFEKMFTSSKHYMTSPPSTKVKRIQAIKTVTGYDQLKQLFKKNNNQVVMSANILNYLTSKDGPLYSQEKGIFRQKYTRAIADLVKSTKQQTIPDHLILSKPALEALMEHKLADFKYTIRKWLQMEPKDRLTIMESKTQKSIYKLFTEMQQKYPFLSGTDLTELQEETPQSFNILKQKNEEELRKLVLNSISESSGKILRHEDLKEDFIISSVDDYYKNLRKYFKSVDDLDGAFPSDKISIYSDKDQMTVWLGQSSDSPYMFGSAKNMTSLGLELKNKTELYRYIRKYTFRTYQSNRSANDVLYSLCADQLDVVIDLTEVIETAIHVKQMIALGDTVDLIIKKIASFIVSFFIVSSQENESFHLLSAEEQFFKGFMVPWLIEKDSRVTLSRKNVVEWKDIDELHNRLTTRFLGQYYIDNLSQLKEDFKLFPVFDDADLKKTVLTVVRDLVSYAQENILEITPIQMRRLGILLSACQLTISKKEQKLIEYFITSSYKNLTEISVFGLREYFKDDYARGRLTFFKTVFSEYLSKQLINDTDMKTLSEQYLLNYMVAVVLDLRQDINKILDQLYSDINNDELPRLLDERVADLVKFFKSMYLSYMNQAMLETFVDVITGHYYSLVGTVFSLTKTEKEQEKSQSRNRLIEEREDNLPEPEPGNLVLVEFFNKYKIYENELALGDTYISRMDFIVICITEMLQVLQDLAKSYDNELTNTETKNITRVINRVFYGLYKRINNKKTRNSTNQEITKKNGFLHFTKYCINFINLILQIYENNQSSDPRADKQEAFDFSVDNKYANGVLQYLIQDIFAKIANTKNLDLHGIEIIRNYNIFFFNLMKDSNNVVLGEAYSKIILQQLEGNTASALDLLRQKENENKKKLDEKTTTIEKKKNFLKTETASLACDEALSSAPITQIETIYDVERKIGRKNIEDFHFRFSVQTKDEIQVFTIFEFVDSFSLKHTELHQPQDTIIIRSVPGKSFKFVDPKGTEMYIIRRAYIGINKEIFENKQQGIKAEAMKVASSSGSHMPNYPLLIGYNIVNFSRTLETKKNNKIFSEDTTKIDWIVAEAFILLSFDVRSLVNMVSEKKGIKIISANVAKIYIPKPEETETSVHNAFSSVVSNKKKI